MKKAILTLLVLMCFSISNNGAAVFAADGSTANLREWIRLGREALAEGDEVKAATYFNMCAGVVAGGETSRINGSALYNVASIYQDSGDLEEAEKYLLKAIDLAKALNYTSLNVIRYGKLSEIYMEMGQPEKALEAAREGIVYGREVNNPNMLSQLQIQEADAMGALGADPAKVQELYEEAIERLQRKGAGKVKYQRIYNKLGNNALIQGDTLKACEYYRKMMQRDWWGGDDLQVMIGAKALSELVKDPEEAAFYAGIADSLSFAPELHEFYNELALASIEFPRRERDAEILRQKSKLTYSIIISLLLLVVVVLLICFLTQRNRMLKEMEGKNADLVKVSLQKDRLLAIARANAESSANEAEIDEISSDEVPLPQVKLTQREIEVARLSSKGLQNKEIAAQLGISPLTVGVHKNNLYRKLGIGNNIELLRYMQKVGL